MWDGLFLRHKPGVEALADGVRGYFGEDSDLEVDADLALYPLCGFDISVTPGVLAS